MNIVFDLGGVVFRWNPDELIASVFKDPKIQTLVKTEIFSHPDWIELDRGTLAEEVAIRRGVERTGIAQTELEHLMQKVPLFLTPIDETFQLIESLKQNRNKIYILSNMHFNSIEHLEKNYSFWHLFDGKVISCRIKMVKPERNIFDYLLSTYNLNALETVFIDDTPVNLKTASQMGITPIVYKSPGQCEDELKIIGCL